MGCSASFNRVSKTVRRSASSNRISKSVKSAIRRALQKSNALRLFLKTLSDDELEYLIDNCQIETISHGIAAINLGESADFLYILLNGSLTMYNVDLVYMDTVDSEECIGELPFLLNVPHSAKYVTKKKCTFAKLPQNFVDEVKMSVPFNFRQVNDFAVVTSPKDVYQYCSVKRLEKGDVFEKAGTKSDHLYYIIEGSLMETGYNKEFMAGSFIGLEILADGYKSVFNHNILASSNKSTVIFSVNSEGLKCAAFDPAKKYLRANRIKSLAKNVGSSGTPPRPVITRKLSKSPSASNSLLALADINVSESFSASLTGIIPFQDVNDADPTIDRPDSGAYTPPVPMRKLPNGLLVPDVAIKKKKRPQSGPPPQRTFLRAPTKEQSQEKQCSLYSLFPTA